METVCWQINDFVAEKDQIADKMMSAGTILVPRSDGLTPNEVMKERAQFGDKLAASRFLHTHPSLHQPSCGVINARPRGLPLRPTPLDVDHSITGAEIARVSSLAPFDVCLGLRAATVVLFVIARLPRFFWCVTMYVTRRDSRVHGPTQTWFGRGLRLIMVTSASVHDTRPRQQFRAGFL
jgi:hypothetical protein